ncbi:MAG: LuxR C-terminal-related transcriptional regulator [Propionibacteriaceae bacterium]
MRALVAEDHALLREGLIRLLEVHDIEVVEAVGDEPSLQRALERDDLDVAILDVRMPPTGTDEGLRAALAVRAQRPGFPVLVLSQYVEQLYARELFASAEGGVGYLLKDRVSNVRQFVDAVHQVAAGGTVMDPEVVSQLLRRQAEPLEPLTPREKEVMELMAGGRSNAAIAEAMFVTEKAVGKHISNIFGKLNLPVTEDSNRRVLAVLAFLQS